MLFEVQALTSPSQLPVPRRIGNGVDYNRLLMLVAVATRRAGLELAGQDIIVSVAGGFRVSEPAADLPVLLAIASSLRNSALDPGLVAFGGGGTQRRAAVRTPSAAPSSRSIPSWASPVVCCLNGDGWTGPQGMELHQARTVREALKAVLDRSGSRRETWPERV